MGNVLNMVGGGGGGIKLLSVAVKTPPNKVKYLPGERFDPAGMVVKAKYSNGATLEATGYAYAPDGSLSEGTDSITIIYTEGGKSVTATQAIMVERGTVQLPTVSGQLRYTGAEQSPQWAGYDSGKMTLGGQTAATNAGSYAASFTPTYQYKWPDGTTTAKSVTWVIGKAPGKVTVTPSSVTLDKDKPTATVSVERLGDGAISVSAGGIVSASVSGNTVTIASVGEKSGDAAVTVNVAEGSNYLAASASVGVEAKFEIILNDLSWDEIRQISDSGKATETFKIGDTKTITINGQVGNTTFNNLELGAFIIGIDHNWEKEGKNKIHFLIGMHPKDHKMVGLYDNSDSNGDYRMNPNNSNSGGWNSCHMRKTVLGGDRNPNSPAANTLLAALPADLRAVMKPVTKYTDNTGNNGTAGAVTATTDYLFLLSEFEVLGVRHYANSYEQNSQTWYAFFDSGNSKVANKYDATGTAVDWWLRSPFCNDKYYFCNVTARDSYDFNTASCSFALLVGFTV